ncbi:uncharacterized protein LOC143291155 isoform X2 [Babylonia areolata]
MMDTALHYTSVNHATCLVSAINRLRIGGQLCDVVIRCGELRIPAHRLVLEASSPYFGPLLGPPPSPSNGVPREIKLETFDAVSVEQIIEFCYTSSICVSEKNIWTLLPTAVQLQISELCTLCTEFLQSTLSPDTSMQTYMVALRSGMTDLAMEAQKVLKEDLDKVLESDGFLEMKVDDMIEALHALPSSVLGHRDSVKAIRHWVQHKSHSREKYAAQLAHSFPGLLSRLKEFLPEDLLVQPMDGDSLPASPTNSTPRFSPASFSQQVSPSGLDVSTHLSPSDMRTYQDSADSDCDLKGLDLTMNSPLLREDASDSIPSDTTDSPSSSPLCLMCGEIFHTQAHLSQHQEECTKLLFRDSGEILENGFPSSPSDLSNSRNEDGDGAVKRGDQHMCQLCFKVFSDKKSLGKHMRTHSQSGFSCNGCDKRYSTRSHLLGHMRVHSGHNPAFPCEYCQHPFTAYCALKVHMRGHKGARPFSCPTCGQHFAKNIHLKRHLSTHTGIKPHECDMCGKHFSRSDHLKRHVQSIHAGQRPHACHLCTKAFVRKYELNKHLQLHTPQSSRPILPDNPWDSRSYFGLGSTGLGIAIPDGIIPTERIEGR